MMKLYDICAKTGQYEQEGQTKNRYRNVGSIFKDDNGKPFMLLSAFFNPSAVERKQGSENIILSLFTPSPSATQKQQPAYQQLDNDYANFEEVPF